MLRFFQSFITKIIQTRGDQGFGIGSIMKKVATLAVLLWLPHDECASYTAYLNFDKPVCIVVEICDIYILLPHYYPEGKRLTVVARRMNPRKEVLYLLDRNQIWVKSFSSLLYTCGYVFLPCKSQFGKNMWTCSCWGERKTVLQNKLIPWTFRIKSCCKANVS